MNKHMPIVERNRKTNSHHHFCCSFQRKLHWRKESMLNFRSRWCMAGYIISGYSWSFSKQTWITLSTVPMVWPDKRGIRLINHPSGSLKGLLLSILIWCIGVYLPQPACTISRQVNRHIKKHVCITHNYWIVRFTWQWLYKRWTHVDANVALLA